jgi:hypothetical protein
MTVGIMTAKLLPIGTILATGALALGYGLGGLWGWTVFAISLGFLWLLGQRRGWDWMASVGLVLFVSVAAAGLCLGVGAGWMLFGLVAALSAWDLDHFAQRLRDTGRVEGVHDLERRHLGRLLTVDGLGLLLGAVALGIEVEFGFGVAFVLGLLAILGLSQAIGFLRRESD